MTRLASPFQLLTLLLFSALRTTVGLNICITGSSQGIGLDAAKRLIAQGGHTIYHACRTAERAEVAVQESGGGIPLVCNLADFDSIRQCAKQISDKPLDVLCLNAGMAPSTKATAPQLTKDGLEDCIGVNHLGHFLLANLLKSQINRLVVMASSVHDPDSPGGAVGGKGGATLGDLSGLGYPLDTDPNGPTMVDGAIEYDGGKVYKDSKLCNILFCREAQNRWAGDGIAIRSLNPGFIPSSGLFRAPRQDNWLGATAFTFIAGLVGFAVPVEVGGERLAYMATASDDEVPSGSYFSADVGSKAATKADGFQQGDISKEGSDDVLAASLWDLSAKIVGL
jgi:light-dependent protochlorophyllide reductase